jgi:uncharacterized phage protein gp47/JayE
MDQLMSQSVTTYPRPSLPDLIQLARADFNVLPGADATLRRSVLGVLAKNNAYLANGEYGYLDWMVVNVLIPGSLTGPYLDRWLAIKGTQLIGALQATGNVIFTGTPNIGIASGTQLQNSDGSVIVTTTSAAVMGSNNTVTVPAIASAGVAGNLAANSPLTMLSAIAGINAVAYVDGSGFEDGTAVETPEAANIRLVALLSAPARGGKVSDYVTWAEQVTGVTRVWVYSVANGLGTVSVAFTMDGRTNIIPLAADLAAVLAVLQANIPEGSTPFTFAPTASVVNIAISNLVILSGYTLAQVQANILAALQALFLTTTPGGSAYDSVQKLVVTGGQLAVEQISAAIANAAGVKTFDLVSPSADINEATGVIPQLGAVTYL